MEAPRAEAAAIRAAAIQAGAGAAEVVVVPEADLLAGVQEVPRAAVR